MSKKQTASIKNFLPVIPVAIAGFLLSLYLFTHELNRDQKVIKSEFMKLAHDRVLSVETGIYSYLQTIRQLKAFYDTVGKVERKDFRKFVKPLLSYHSDIQALEWIPRVPQSERKSYEESARKAGFQDFEFIERDVAGQLVRASQRDEYFPVYFVEPLKGNEPALGYNLASDKTRLEALTGSRKSGMMVATSRISLVQERGNQFGFLVFMPVYENSSVVVSDIAAQSILKGFVLGVFRVGDIIRNSIKDLSAEEIDMFVYDISDKENKSPLYFHSSNLQSNNGIDALENTGNVVFSETIDVADRQWTIVCIPGPEFISTRNSILPRIYLIVGFGITFFIVFYLLKSMRRTAEIEMEVANRTKELRESEERLKKEAMVNKAMADLSSSLLSAELSLKEISEIVLNKSIALTESSHGVVAEVDQNTGEVIGHTLTNMMDRECKITKDEQTISFPKGPEGYNALWGHALNTKESFFTNNPRKHFSYKDCTPQGHVKIERYLNVPAVIDDRLVGQIALANSKRDYTEEDVKVIEKLAVIYSLAIERTKAVKDINILKRTLDQTQDGVFLFDFETLTFFYINHGALKQTGYTADELFNMTPLDIKPEFTEESFRKMIAPLLAGECESITFETVHKHKNGAITPVEIVLQYIASPGERSRFIAIVRDITERKKMEEQIRMSLKEKELLLGEIHHRVKNNLAIVSSILSMQRNYITDQKHQELFIDTESRIRSMALIHEKLYRSKDLARIDFREYVESLSNSLFNTYKTAGLGEVALKADIDEIFLGIDTAVPCGLLLNELITNSLKHAFPESRDGELRIRMHKGSNNHLELVVSDNGVGMPKGLDILNTESLGYQLIVGLSGSQLGGEIEVKSEGGTEVRARFPLAEMVSHEIC